MIKSGIKQKRLNITRSLKTDRNELNKPIKKEIQAFVEMARGLHVHPSTIVQEFTIAVNKLFYYYLQQELDISLIKVFRNQQVRPDSVLNLISLAVARGDKVRVRVSIPEVSIYLDQYRVHKLEQLLTMVVKTYGCLLSIDDETRMEKIKREALNEIKHQVKLLSNINIILSVLRPLLGQKDH